MTHLSWRLASLAILSAVIASPAIAQKPAADPLTGFWKFETKVINGNCKLSGDMEIMKEKSGYTCKFVSAQSCTGENPIEIKVAQSCSVKQASKKVVIQSTITRIVSVKPKELMDVVKERYEPDHFNVTLNPTGSEMNGIFHSIGEATVRFWRPEALTS